MPPKKKGGKKKKSAKAKTPTVIDGISTEEMSKEQLEEHIVRLREELDREREERNYFQLERDKVNTFWEITKRQLEEKKADLRNKDREMEDAEERHQIEIKVYKQKVKHLLYEHQNNISELKAQNTVSLKMTQDENRAEESTLRKDKRSLKVELKEQELAHEDIIKNLKKVCVISLILFMYFLICIFAHTFEQAEAWFWRAFDDAVPAESNELVAYSTCVCQVKLSAN